MIELSTLTNILLDVAPEIEAVENGTQVGFYRFVSGPYAGITYTYGDIRFTEVGDHMELGFVYIIVQNEMNVDVDDDNEPLFKQTIGDLLIRIIEAAVDEEDAK